eukprot:Gregarina_sp_Poly_1__213@NODE_104_length_14336_cov_169_911977_g91_i0_p3_GENE_NODE_104_length_14336_cov_169_911977_g91_i0NODE_104_length_14336_cov_169_911977_g91_i0_p3_ORF_typecomplete_len416_score66_10Helicase_RecD/PF05127_14/4_3e19DUF1726/PF08351_11/5_5e13AAA_30/PF13604_6/68AAA_30/PF13604_6/0_095AAA_16/PF13191_6/7_1e02AAA_16/PF13191_6/5_3e03AAA_16/PF13191_6/0_36Terminase_1/PF03354_15/0_078AAA_25/PF13481_6/9_1e03AAA_25/PF13481_6/0_47DUF1892/PF08987_10/0_34_NODE_104_length_14336_cov_169_911977_g9
MAELVAKLGETGHRTLIFLETGDAVSSSQLEACLRRLFLVRQSSSILNLLWVHTKSKKHVGGDGKKSAADRGRDGDDRKLSGHIRFKKCLYRSGEAVLGKTFDGLILEDLTGITPNNLSRFVETVRSGGLIVLVVDKDRDKTRLEVSKKLDASNLSDPHAPTYLLPRLVASLRQNSIGIDANLRGLPGWPGNLNLNKFCKKQESQADPAWPSSGVSSGDGKCVGLCANPDQAKCLVQLQDFCCLSQNFLRSGRDAEMPHKKVAWLTAARGRGKSALMGLLAACICAAGVGVSVMAPDEENVGTLFQFVERGFESFGMSFRRQCPRGFHSTVFSVPGNASIDFLAANKLDWNSWNSGSLGRWCESSVLIIDEAASIPVPIIREALGTRNVKSEFRISVVNLRYCRCYGFIFNSDRI